MTVDLATLTKDSFDAHRGERFVMRVDEARAIELELLSTESLPTAANAKRGAFLVRFRTTERDHVPQRIYALEHATLGTLELFLVPVGPDAVGMRYDAVFS